MRKLNGDKLGKLVKVLFYIPKIILFKSINIELLFNLQVRGIVLRATPVHPLA